MQLTAGAPGEIRTPDPQIRSLVLYPAELRARSRRAGKSPAADAACDARHSYSVHPPLASAGGWPPAAPAIYCTRGTACQPQLFFSAATSSTTALARRKPSAAIGMPA